MKKNGLIILVVFILSAWVLSACGGSAQPAQATDVPIPAAYQGKTNPVAGKADAIAAGKTAYDTNCASCHGPAGKGDGSAGASLNPKPADLIEPAANDADELILFRIMDGKAGGPANSGMPAWKGVLTDDQVWQVIAYLRSLAKK